MKKSLSVFLLLAPVFGLWSQTPASSTIHVNNVKAVVNADGALFTDGVQGQFIPVEPGLAEISLLRSSGIWLGGIDPAGNFKGAVYTSGLSDFGVGTLDENGQPLADVLNNVWRVNCADIAEVHADLSDNNVFDNPNPAVLGWPASGNPYFAQYNAPPDLPFTSQRFAGFYDYDQDGLYNPAKGDYPSVEVRGCPLNHIPNDMSWFVYNDRTISHPSNLNSIGMEVQAQVLVYKTAAPSPLNNSIFVRYKLINRADDRIDSCYFGLYTDFSIGNPDDDFVGLNVSKSLVYGYNGDANDEGGFGTEAPVVGVRLFRGPLDTLGNELDMSHFIVLNDAAGLDAVGFHRVLSGVLPDGTPAPNNGLMYPGNPNDPAGQSELALGHTPGHRVGVASYGPFTLKPGAVNELIVGYTYAWHSGFSAIDNIQTLLAGSSALQSLFNNCFESFDIQCDGLVSATEAPVMEHLSLYPNPAAETCTLESKSAPLERVVITDMLGRVVRQITLDRETMRYDFSTSAMPVGMYRVQSAGKQMLLAVQH